MSVQRRAYPRPRLPLQQQLPRRLLTPPLELENLEGFRYLIGAYPDREIMAILPGPFTSASFPLTQLSPTEWDSPERWKRVDDLNSAIEQGPPTP